MTSSSEQPKPPSFWARQFAGDPTEGQLLFDVVAGIVLPLFCLIADPIVFRASVDRPLLAGYRTVGLVAIAGGMLSLIAWLSLRRPAALFVGLLGGGFTFACLLGLVLLPYSVIALIIVIGLLGFSPFLTAFVFFRNGWRAYAQVEKHVRPAQFIAIATLGFVVSCGGPWIVQFAVNWHISRAERLILSNDPRVVDRGIGMMRSVGWLSDFESLVAAFEKETDPALQSRIATAYRELTGVEIRSRTD
jgi:hypothetical protein